MIVTVTLNPAIDLTYTVPAIELGQSHRVQNPAARAGGKGVNVARVLTGQGVAAMVIAPIGGATGAEFRAELDSAGLHHRLVDAGPATRRTIALVTRTQTTNVNEAGSPLSQDEWEQVVTTITTALQEASVLVISGSTPPHTPLDMLPRLINAAAEREIPVVVDTSGEYLLAAAEAGPTVLKPNREELLTALSRESSPSAGPLTGNPNLDHIADAARILAARGGSTVFASLGGEGMLAVGPEGTVSYARLPRPLPGNPTGAGDAAVAAIAADLAGDDFDRQSSLVKATAWSASAVLAPLAGTLTDPAPLLGAVRLRTNQ